MKQITNPDNNMWRSADPPQRTERVAARIGGGGLYAIDREHRLSDKSGSVFHQSLKQINDRQLKTNDIDCIANGLYSNDKLLIDLNEAPERMKAKLRIDYSEFRHMIADAQSIHHNEPDVYFYHSDHLGSASWITDNGGLAVQHLQYLPYGERYVDQRTAGYHERFTFTGKERDEETGYGYFGARYMDHELMTMWLSVDPMSDKYPSISPYAYCAWNPVKLVDPDGEKPVFVNGYLGFGSPEGGEKYWSPSFVSGAKKFFNDYTKPYFTNVEHSMLSSAKSRHQNGYDYAKANYSSLIEGMNEGETFEFVSHSMGGAFAMGMRQYLEEQGWEVKSMVFINTYQSDKIIVNENDPSFLINYQNTNDPVLFWFDLNLGRGEIKNADVKIREKSDQGTSYIHAGPISSGKIFWEELQKKVETNKTNE